MISGTLTLFQWSLRSDARAFWPHVARAGFAFFMLLSIAIAYADAFGTSGPGLRFFDNISMLNVLLISVSGVGYFVNAVTDEKDSGTLPLLRLAGVTPLAIILGKSTSRLISLLMLLLIQLPFTFLAITLGGITWQQILGSWLALAAWMALVANLALFCSVRCQTAGRAAGMLASVLFLFFSIQWLIVTGVTPAAARVLPWWLVSLVHRLGEWQQAMSVTNSLQEILITSGGTYVALVRQIWWDMAAALTLFAASVLCFDRWVVADERAVHGESARTRRFTVGRCWRLPVVWRDFLFFTGGRTFFIVKLVSYGGLVYAVSYFQNRGTWSWSLKMEGYDAGWTALISLLGVLQVEVLLYASGILFSEVRQSTIASLTLLPISIPRLLAEKSLACSLATLPVLFWISLVFVMNYEVIKPQLSATMIVTAIVVMLVSTHLTMLLSLITRWAALPLAVLLTIVAFMCAPMIILSTFSVANAISQTHRFDYALVLGVVANIVWVWLFVLLPIEIEIIRQWTRMSSR